MTRDGTWKELPEDGDDKRSFLQVTQWRLAFLGAFCFLLCKPVIFEICTPSCPGYYLYCCALMGTGPLHVRHWLQSCSQHWLQSCFRLWLQSCFEIPCSNKESQSRQKELGQPTAPQVWRAELSIHVTAPACGLLLGKHWLCRPSAARAAVWLPHWISWRGHSRGWWKAKIAKARGPNGGNFVKACAGFFGGAISMLECKSV